jgi:hypothetical protein
MDELLQDNRENIQAHVNEIGEAAVEEVKKNLKGMLAKAFSGNTSIKVK